MKTTKSVLAVLFFLCLAQTEPLDASEERGTQRSLTVKRSPTGDRVSGSPPLVFIENHGQWHTPAHFVARSRDMTVALEQDALRLDLRLRRPERRTQRATLRFEFENAASTGVEGIDPLPTVYNFFRGNDPSLWQADVRSHGKVIYRDLYAGIDLQVRASGGQLEYDLILAPGADLGQVVVHAHGARGLCVDVDGALLVDTPLGTVRQPPPVSWVEHPDGATEPIDCRFELLDENRYGFSASEFDPGLLLVIDPRVELAWSTYMGGTADDSAGLRNCIVVDDDGLVYVAGSTDSDDFAEDFFDADPDVHASENAGETDVFVMCYDPSESAILWATYLGGGDPMDEGGSANDRPEALSVRGTGDDVILTVAGFTCSKDFPTVDAYDDAADGGCDGFVSRLQPSLSGVEQCTYSTYFGGSLFDVPLQVFDDGAEITLVGYTTSEPGGEFVPTGDAYADAPGVGSTDAFILVVDPDPASPDAGLVYFTFIGGEGRDIANDAHMDDAGVITICGSTNSEDFPTSDDAYSAELAGAEDVFVLRFDRELEGDAQVVYSTFLGGAARDIPNGIEVDKDGVITVAGHTFSTEDDDSFPLEHAYDDTHNGAQDVFVAQIDWQADASEQLLWSTYLGDDDGEIVRDMRLRSDGLVVVVGWTESSDFPVTLDAYDDELESTTCTDPLLSPRDGFMSILDPALGPEDQLVYSTYVGGCDRDTVRGVLPVESGLLLWVSTRSPDLVVDGADVACDSAIDVDCDPHSEAYLMRFDFVIERFLRGDANGNDTTDALADGLYILKWGFVGGPVPPCMDAADVDDDGKVNALQDAIYLLRYGFQDGDVPPDPGPDACGLDPDDPDDRIDCETPPACKAT